MILILLSSFDGVRGGNKGISEGCCSHKEK